MIESYGIPKKQNMFGCETFQREQKQSTKSGTYVYIMAPEASYIQIHAQYEVNVFKKKLFFLHFLCFAFIILAEMEQQMRFALDICFGI